jgi:multisubunit Na+/H+ antiporter MnhG subunit
VSPGTAAAYAVVALAVAMAGAATVGLTVARSALDRLHYVSVVSTACPPLVALAVVVHDSLHQTAFKALCVAGITIATGPLIVHVTAQAIGAPEDEPPG